MSKNHREWVWRFLEEKKRFDLRGERAMFIPTNEGQVLRPLSLISLAQLRRERREICLRRGWDPVSGEPMDRARKVALLLERLADDYKTVKRDGSVWLMVGRQGGSWLVPIEQLTDEEIDFKVGCLVWQGNWKAA